MEVKSNHNPIIEVTIAGMSFKLRSAHDEATVRELVSFVDKRVREALNHVKSGNLQTATLLATLNLAEELMLLRKQAGEKLDRLENKTERIIASLENSRIPKQAEL